MTRYPGSDKPGDSRRGLRLDRCPRAADQLSVESISVYLIGYIWTRGEFISIRKLSKISKVLTGYMYLHFYDVKCIFNVVAPFVPSKIYRIKSEVKFLWKQRIHQGNKKLGTQVK